MQNVEREFELKLGMADDALKQFRDKPILREIGIGRPETRKLRAIYYDTPGHSLQRAGFSLRVRREGGKWLQTVKGMPADDEEGLSRLENEVEVKAPEPDTDRIRPGRFRKKVVAALGGDTLEPVFETNVWRTTRVLEAPDEGRIELAVDTGEITHQDQSQPISEIELELKSGDPHAVFTIAKDILNGEPFRLIRQSKAARGYGLCDNGSGIQPAPRKAEAVSLSKNQTVGEAFQAIVFSCCRQVLNNLDTALQSDDPEGPHQLRIGLRRLRCALKAHRKILARDFVDDLDQSARILARLVGELRDMDVLIDEFVTPYATGSGQAAQTKALIASLRDYRKGARRAMEEGILSGTYSQFQLNLMGLLAGDIPSEAAGGKKRHGWDEPVTDLAIFNLERSWSRVTKYGSRIDKLTVSQRHAMRKALKNHRYMVEFYSSLFPRRAVQRHVKRLKRLQTDFGYLNDVAMAHKIRKIYETSSDPQGEIFWTIGHLQGLHDARAEDAWRAAKVDWRKLEGGKRFWHAH